MGKERTYICKTLAKIQVTDISLKKDGRIHIFPQIYRDLYGDAMLVPGMDGYQHGDPIP